MTKQEQRIVQNYTSLSNRGLLDVYGNPSTQKQMAYSTILHEMKVKQGYDLRVLSYNTFMFTVAYCYINDKGQEILVYHTPNKRQEIILE